MVRLEKSSDGKFHASVVDREGKILHVEDGDNESEVLNTISHITSTLDEFYHHEKLEKVGI